MLITIDNIKQGGVVAVLRNMNLNNALQIATTLHENGIKILEITVEAEEGLEVIKLLTSKMPKTIMIGAGTVLDPETAKSAINAGAQFIFSPNVNLETIRMTKRYGAFCVPGALTPTEILKAYEHGADAVKVFPIRTFGPQYLKDLSGPYPQIPLIPTGGINIKNIKDYLKSGAVAVGVGTSLVDPSKSEEKNFYELLKHNAIKFVQQVESARINNY